MFSTCIQCQEVLHQQTCGCILLVTIGLIRSTNWNSKLWLVQWISHYFVQSLVPQSLNPIPNHAISEASKSCNCYSQFPFKIFLPREQNFSKNEKGIAIKSKIQKYFNSRPPQLSYDKKNLTP